MDERKGEGRAYVCNYTSKEELRELKE